MNRKDVALDLDAVQQKLAEATGKTYWTSLEELAQTEAFQEMLHREFPENATEWGNPITRRRFLMLMGASLALAGVTGCSRGPHEKILPYVTQPEGILPSKPQFYATALALGGHVTGVLVESHMGRPTKVEGNPDHPASLGATDVFAQADILNLYDPDREQAVTHLGRPRGWEDALNAIRAAVTAAGGAGVRILTDTVTSPTLADQLRSLFASKPYDGARLVVHEPTGATEEAAALRAAFGNQDVEAYYNIKDADVIVSLDADFLCGPGASVRYAREFGERRRFKPGEENFRERQHGVYSNDRFGNRLNRLYVVETMPSPTGSVADHRLPLKPSEIDGFVRALAAAVGVENVKDADNEVVKNDHNAKWVKELAADLKSRGAGKTLVIPGPYQPAQVHQLAHAINQKLGNLGKTVQLIKPVHQLPAEVKTQTLGQLIDDMKAGTVKVLLVLGGNPSYTVPPVMGFNEAMDQVPLRVHLSLFNDETSAKCHWHLPATHTLEQWSDARTYDGTATIVQPLIAPLYSGRSAHEVIATLGDSPALSGLDLVKSYWRKWHEKNKGELKDARAKDDFELFWKQSLYKGVVDGTASKPETPAFALPGLPSWRKGGDYLAGQYEVVFRPDSALFDGRYANNGWMQEFPKPITKITWDNVAHIGFETAKRLGVTYTHGRRGGEHGETYIDVLTLKLEDGREIKVPAWIVPGHPEGVVTLTMGYGRTKAGRVSMTEERKPIGVDVGPLRDTATAWAIGNVKVGKAGGRHLVACIQAHYKMEDRDLIRTLTTVEEKHGDHSHYRFQLHQNGHGGHAHKEEEKKGPEKSLNILPPHPQKPGYHRWGMVINLGACTGCAACVVACQAENNIPVVGKEQVNRGREMHWLRIDRYYAGEPGKPETIETEHQPVPCMQCENAPCEQVCPVSATVHSEDGLNDMVYNRCVGTRYCSNNCPYKVRRFNFLLYQNYANDSLKLVRNPDVTVRTRGVMEKCTYCVQRIRQAEIEARKDERERIEDGDVMTACQAACATGAISFGDLGPADQKPTSAVGQLRASPINYSLLEELNTQPRTTYLPAVKNPNPALLDKPVEQHEGNHDEKKG